MRRRSFFFYDTCVKKKERKLLVGAPVGWGVVGVFEGAAEGAKVIPPQKKTKAGVKRG